MINGGQVPNSTDHIIVNTPFNPVDTPVEAGMTLQEALEALQGQVTAAQLIGTENQINIIDGVISLSDSIVLPGTLNLNGNDILSESGQNIRIAPGNPNLDWIDLQSKTVNILQSIIFNNAPTNNIFYNSVDHEFYFNANNDRVLSLSASGVSLGANLLLNTYKITSSAGTSLQLIPDNDSDGIDLSSTVVRIEQDIRHAGDESNKMSFTTAAQTNYIGGTSIYDINASGFRLGMGYRVNTITNDAASVSDTALWTAYAGQTAIANALIGANPFQGFWDASGGSFPTTESGGDPIVAGDWWRISVAGTLGGVPVSVGNQIFATIDNPGQTASNWSIINPRVYSVYGRTGTVVAEDGDYPFNFISGLPDTATSGTLMRGNGTGWVETTATFADTYAANSLLLATSLNNVSGLATQNSSYLGTDGSGNVGWILFPVAAANGGTGQNTTSVGDLLVGASSNAWVKLAKANSSYLTTDASGNPGWTALPDKQIITTSTYSLQQNGIYSSTYPGLMVGTLPTTAAFASVIEVYAGPSGNTFKIAQNAGQQIYYGAQNGVSISTTAGTSGYLQSVDPNTTVRLVCTVPNTTWIVTSNVNNLTVA